MAKQLTKEARALLDKYRAEIMRTRVDFYDRGGALRTGLVVDVRWYKGDIDLVIACTDTYHVRPDAVRIAK